MENLLWSGVAITPVISKGEYKSLGDDAASHRWRAGLDRVDGNPSGIRLVAHPVIKTTRCGAWVSNYSDFRMVRWVGPEAEFKFAPWEDWMGKRLVLNGSRSAWAKPTQEEAIYSLAVRLTRWAQNVQRDVDRVRSAAAGLSVLRPDLLRFADWSLESVGRSSGGYQPPVAS